MEFSLNFVTSLRSPRTPATHDVCRWRQRNGRTARFSSCIILAYIIYRATRCFHFLALLWAEIKIGFV